MLEELESKIIEFEKKKSGIIDKASLKHNEEILKLQEKAKEEIKESERTLERINKNLKDVMEIIKGIDSKPSFTKSILDGGEIEKDKHSDRLGLKWTHYSVIGVFAIIAFFFFTYYWKK